MAGEEPASELRPVAQAAAGRWVVDQLQPIGRGAEGVSIRVLMPAGFQAYARILHPCRLGPRPMRWADVAAWGGRRLHPEVQFEALARPMPGHGLPPPPYDNEPRLGPADLDLATPLVSLLAAFTETPETCFFGRWDGYGQPEPLSSGAPSTSGLRTPPPAHAPPAALLEGPDRAYRLYSGPLAGALGQPARGWGIVPDLWWPADQAWFVGADVDLPSTYVGGSRECIERLLASEELEVVPASIRDRVDIGSDTINSDPPGYALTVSQPARPGREGRG